MSTDSPISDDAVRAALTNLAADPRTPQKLAWWLLGANSAERWLQFEFAYQLSRFFDGRYAVLCERQWRDIVVIPRPPNVQPIWQNAAAAAIELKWLGNWYVIGSTFADINADVAKVDAYDIPSIALVICLLAEPKERSADYQWLRNQVKGGIGVPDAAQIATKMDEHCGRRFHLASTAPCVPTDDFDRLEMFAYVCRNDPAT